MLRSRATTAALALLVWAWVQPSSAQELKTQPTPFTSWIDFRTVSGRPGPKLGLPIWVESVQRVVTTDTSKATFRIRFRHLAGLDDQLQFRLFYKDVPDKSPSVSGWTETGSQPFFSGPLGEGLDVDSSETMIVPAAALDYLDVEVPGDGSNVRGAFVSSLRRHDALHALDFGTPPPLIDPFGVPNPATPDPEDKFLFGRVRATLDAVPLKLDPVQTFSGQYEFNLDTRPLLASISVELLDASPTTPVNAFVNGQSVGPVMVTFPDLADPAYRGESRPLERSLRFRYEGWLRGRIMIPGHLLVGGSNTLLLQLSEDSSPVVIRAVEIELKYPSTVFDYETHP